MKYSGKVGYAVQTETAPGVWTKEIKEVHMYGDTLSYGAQPVSSDKVNQDVALSNEISLMGNPIIFENLSTLEYLILSGIKWEITSINLDPPRIKVALGGVWNG